MNEHRTLRCPVCRLVTLALGVVGMAIFVVTCFSGCGDDIIVLPTSPDVSQIHGNGNGNGNTNGNGNGDNRGNVPTPTPTPR